MRVLELFCGIGGCAAALDPGDRVVAAVDINALALEVYAANFPHTVWCRSVESLDSDRLIALGADLWWLSPPCQPYTRRGRRRDLDDRRASGLLHLVARLEEVRPPWVALENVPEFAGSRSHALLEEALDHHGYAVETLELCPTDLGIPNRRRRFYLLAGRGASPGPRPRLAEPRQRLAPLLDPRPAPGLAVDPVLVERYSRAIDRVCPDDPQAVAATFTAAYGRSPVRSGSFLETASGWRRFSPAEILRLLGFPAGYRLPPGLPLANAWRLVGNSVSVHAVRHLLAGIPRGRNPLVAPRAAGASGSG
jgi:DNA (cytosine-5)-methyltransferase 1